MIKIASVTTGVLTATAEALGDEIERLRLDIKRLQSAYEVLKTECAEYYANEEIWADEDFERGREVVGVDDPYCNTLKDETEMEDMMGYHIAGKRARLALKKAELIRSGG